jgi:hypothetical protein
MIKLINALVLGIVGLVALAAAAPAISRMMSAAVPLVLVVGIVVAVLRLVDHYTRR